MYQPPHFREERLALQHALIRRFPLGLLVSAGPSGPMANPLPFVLDADASPRGTLRGHLARANPQWRELAGEALVVFQGADGYVTPSWYATKRETGKVVPTWNYVMVQARGPVRVIEDEGWLREQIEALTRMQEGARTEPWAVDDAPAPFVAAQIRGIVGIEIEIARIEGKWKVSQNRPEADRRGVAAGLRAEPDGDAMAELVETFGGLRD
ncbi:MAG TPA: FMN-binding negative transcriptional regulator [Beijerinckiaceae bacterium]|nr:FMN-binding negative transcriptional regulator [Beijerinckiaceae bacterium]